jgi:hypothetical protein
MSEGLLFLKPLHRNRGGTCTDWDVSNKSRSQFGRVSRRLRRRATGFGLTVIISRGPQFAQTNSL